MPDCLIAMGANLGDRAATLAAAVEAMHALSEVHEVRPSHWFETAPVGGPGGQGAFLNAAVRCRTSLPPHDLMTRLLEIERGQGRERNERWGPRSLDLDLLLYDQQQFDDERLQVPHPRMAFRRFVLDPAAEVAPAMLHPPTGLTIAALLDRLEQWPLTLALVGGAGETRTALANQVARQCNVEVTDRLADPADTSLPTASIADDETAARVVIATDLLDATGQVSFTLSPTLLVVLTGDTRHPPPQFPTVFPVPRLELPADDRSRAEHDLLAAVAAMRERPRKLPDGPNGSPPRGTGRPSNPPY